MLKLNIYSVFLFLAYSWILIVGALEVVAIFLRIKSQRRKPLNSEQLCTLALELYKMKPEMPWVWEGLSNIAFPGCLQVAEGGKYIVLSGVATGKVPAPENNPKEIHCLLPSPRK